MKKTGRISLLVCLCAAAFAGGCYCNSLYLRWFYPNTPGLAAREERQEAAEPEPEPEAPLPQTQSSVPETERVSEAAAEQMRTTADTRFEIRSYDIRAAVTEKEETPIPEQYIGMNREQLEEALEQYRLSPPLSEQKKGFTDLRLLAFSSRKVTVEKTYYLPDEAERFVLVAENNYVTVYRADTQEVYLYTDIRLDELPEEVQEAIILRKQIDSEAELYNFLESYSS